MSTERERELQSEDEMTAFIQENNNKVVVILIYDPISGAWVEEPTLARIRKRFAQQEQDGLVIFARINTKLIFYLDHRFNRRDLYEWQIYYKGKIDTKQPLWEPQITVTSNPEIKVVNAVDRLTRQLAPTTSVVPTTSSECGATATVTVTQYEATLTVTVDSAGTPAERRRWANMRGRAIPTGRVDPWRRAEPQGRAVPTGFVRRFRP
ncbi:hypothetical protein TWF281_011150 [Arthrobotrys megalospora]